MYVCFNETHLGSSGLLFALMLTVNSSGLQAQIATLTFGVVLDQLASKLGGLIEKAANAGEVIEAGAGGQIAIAIANAKTAYVDSLNITVDHLNAELTKVLNDLSTEVGYVEQHALAELKKIADQGELTVNAFPLSKTFPQVSRSYPTYTAVLGESIDIEVYGNFFDAARVGYTPTLQIGDKSFQPSVNTVLRVVFNVDSKTLKRASNALTYVNMLLTVPYREQVAWLFHGAKKQRSSFEQSSCRKEPAR